MANRYKAYSEYKDSEVEWMVAMPSNWDRVSIRWSANLYAGGTPSKNVESYWEEGTVPWLNSGAVNQRIVTEPSTLITEAAFKNSSAKWIPKGALVIALAGQGKTKGMVASLAISTTCNQSMAALVPREVKSSRYLFWWLDSNYQNIRNMSGGDHRDGLNLELLGNIQCPTPSLPEQTQIAKFLDHETAKIDRLIEKQQTLIALLKEKRQAVISHAVTKGLDPNAPMKDSGVEWLGQLPEHWTILKSFYLYSRSPRNGVSPAISDVRNAIPTFSISAVRDGVVDIANHLKWTSIPARDAKNFEVNGGDILLVRGNGNQSMVGLAGVVKGAVPSRCIYPDILIRVKLQEEKITSAFYVIAWNSAYVREQLERRANTTNGTYKISGEDIRRVMLSLPPVDEQKAIVNAVERQLSKFSKMIEAADSLFTTLQERRIALISAAVSGKIDVRNWEAKAEAQNIP